MDLTQINLTEQVEDAIQIKREIDAPRDVVFKCWTEPERIIKWFSPRGFTTPYCTIDLRNGGIFRICMRSADGKNYWSKGIFREILTPHRIIRTDVFSDEQGHTVSPEKYGIINWPQETIITVNFVERAERTEVTVNHTPIRAGKERDMCEQGWNECLDKLSDYLTQN